MPSGEIGYFFILLLWVLGPPLKMDILLKSHKPEKGDKMADSEKTVKAAPLNPVMFYQNLSLSP